MKRLLSGLIVAALVLQLSSCSLLDDLLTKNFLSDIAKTKFTPDKIAGMSTADLFLESQSPSFFETLAEDPALAAAALDNVEAVLASGAPPEEKQEAAIIAASIVLETTAAATLIDNIVDLLPTLGDPTVLADPMALLDRILPTPNGVPLTEAAFKAMIDAFVAADAYYDALGATLLTTPYTDPAMNPGEIAQNALIAALVTSIVPPSGTLADYLWAARTGAPIAEPFIMPPTIGTPLGAILDAAGIDLDALTGSI